MRQTCLVHRGGERRETVHCDNSHELRPKIHPDLLSHGGGINCDTASRGEGCSGKEILQENSLIHADIYNLTTRILPSPSPSRSGYPPLYWKQKKLAEIRWCHKTEFSNFPKITFLDFWISGYFAFLILAMSLEWRKLLEIQWCQDDCIFGRISDFQKKNEFLDKSKNPKVSVFFGFLAISLEQRELLEIH